MADVKVVPHENGWKLLEDGKETGELYETQERAAEAARSRIGDSGGEVQGGGSGQKPSQGASDDDQPT